MPTSPAALGHEPMDRRFKGIPASRWGQAAIQVCTTSPRSPCRFEPSTLAVPIALEHQPQAVEGEMAVVVLDRAQVRQHQRRGVAGGHHRDVTAEKPSTSSRIRLTSPSTSPANPKTAPACMHSTVFFPITERGQVSSTLRSAAERAAAASEDTCTPGAIAPPRNSPWPTPRRLQIDEPKSTMIAAVPYLW